MDNHDFEKVFWRMYLELEGEFLDIEKTIPIDSHNSKTFSYKYMRLLESICAEIDVLFKRFAEFKGTDCSSIGKYEEFIENNFTDFKNAEITLYPSRYSEKKLYPFKNWKQNNPPKWWTVNNKVKHHRDEKDDNNLEWYKNANQENVLNALSGLFQLNLYVYKDIISKKPSNDAFDVPLPASEIFHLENWGDYYNLLVGTHLADKAIFKHMHDFANAFAKSITKNLE